MNRPDHIHWRFGKQTYSSFAQSGSPDFHFWFSSSIERRPYSFRLEVRNACAEMDRRRNGRRVALCYSAGIDSEVIALTLLEMGIPFDLYFLDLWGLNRARFEENSRAFLGRTQLEVRVVRASRAEFYERYAPAEFRASGLELPTYLALTYLFRQIPADDFLVVGDGDLDRTGNLFAALAKRGGAHEGFYLPFSPLSTFYYSWAEAEKRVGEFYFFSSTPALLAAMVSDPAFSRETTATSTREVIYRHFPEIPRREKTTNWDDGAYLENGWIRQELARLGPEIPGFANWRPALGTMVDINGIFFS